MKRLVICAIVLAVAAPAFADDGCDKFAWSIARERTLFAASDKLVVKAGDALSSLPGTAVTLALQPDAQANFAMPPERKPKAEHWFGGILKLPAPDKPGVYQVTLSDEAWIDAVQDGRYARSVGSSGRSDCPGLRKSVRFELGAVPLVLQVSGVTSDRIVVAFSSRD